MIIKPETSISEIHVGDRFLNTTWTVNGQWYREKDNSGHWRTYVPVKCDCGTEVRGRWDRLHTTDASKAPWSSRCAKCGYGRKRTIDATWHNVAKDIDDHTQNTVNDLSGKFIGDLYIIRRVGTDKSSHSLYECRCSCGRVEIFRDQVLKSSKHSGPRVACRECLNHASQGEKWIKSKLIEKGIRFKEQYIFEDLIGDAAPLRFDFALVDKFNQPYALIEFQGEQHYHPVSFFGGKPQFEKQQRYDQLKRDYCKKKGIKLIEIPYTKYIEAFKE